MAKNITAAAILLTSVGLTFLLNVLLIITYNQRKRLRAHATIASSRLYVHLAVVDILGSLLWTTTTAYAAISDDWLLGDILCSIQAYIPLFCYMVNTITLVILMAERFLRMFMPSKRQEIHISPSATLLITFTYIAGATFAAFPAIPLSPITEQYYPSSYQCELASYNGAGYFIFFMVVFVGLSFGFVLISYIAILIKLAYLKRMRSLRGYIVLQQEGSSDAYFFKFQIQLETLKNIAKKDSKSEEKLDKYHGKDGYFIDKVSDSSDEEFEENNTSHPKGWVFLSRQDMQLLHMYAIISAVYLLLWIPYFVHLYQYTYVSDDSHGKEFVLVAVCLSHFGGVCKVPFYLLSDNIRGAVLKTIGINKTHPKPKETADILENHTRGT